MSVQLDSLDALAEQFDTFLIDQFGVLMKGDGPYAFAPAALQKLAALGKRIIVLSNSGKRSVHNNDRFVTNGFTRESFETVLSSGEVAFDYLKLRIGDTIQASSKVLVLSREGDLSSIEGLPLTATENPDEADLILLAGSRGDVQTLEDYRTVMQGPADRGIKCLCTNPDMTMLTPKGLRFAAGKIASLYEDMGGNVEWIGKPYPMIYDAAYRLLGQPARDTIVCIGDSPAHDILGGQRAGFKTTLVRTGIHADESDAMIAYECEKLGTVPDFIMPQFSFSR
ncbi:MAG: TIGR01459 family HAD-type hydrolase [Hyphomicrobiales bacterium]|nr:TIGR01459 family HAD-type hydrolase [Hyphomicrobiales bacterium]PCJ81849.1 MAG: TIGR01459 family HAD-type hydrolase [Hyphomicrobiales bacterium]